MTGSLGNIHLEAPCWVTQGFVRLYLILIFFAQHLPPQNTTSVIADQVAPQGDYEVGNASINAVGHTVDL